MRRSDALSIADSPREVKSGVVASFYIPTKWISRKPVERAKGILQYKYKLTEEEACLRLRNESRRLQRPMKDLAEAIILTEDLSRTTTSEES